MARAGRGRPGLGDTGNGLRQRRRRGQWAQAAVQASTTLALGCSKLGGSAGSGLGSHRRAAGLRARSSRRGAEQEPGHWMQGTRAQSKWVWCGMKMSRGPLFIKSLGS